jgi:hypothetical protein
MRDKLDILDVVALLAYLPGEPVQPGQIGTIVEKLTDTVYEVEFADGKGRTLTTCAVPGEQLLKLRYELVNA